MKEFERIISQITQDVNDEKDEAVYCPSEIKGLLDLYVSEIENCDLHAKSLADIVERRKEEIEERDRTIAQQSATQQEYLIQIDELKRELAFVQNLHSLAIGELGELASVEHEARLKGSLIEILVKVIHRLDGE
jgi:hypothetical protein